MHYLAITTPTLQRSLTVVAGILLTVLFIRLADQIRLRSYTFRLYKISGRIEIKVVWLVTGTVAAIIALLGVGLVVGDYPIPASKAITTALWDRNGEYAFIINSLRFPRIVVAILAGMCFASSGLIFQSLINNPLVSPDIIGINSGAAVLAVGILAAGGNVGYLPWAAFVGALLTASLIYLLSWKRGVSATRLVLIGIGVNSLLGAGITFITVKYPIDRVIAAARWQAGTLFGASWGDVRTLSIGLLVLLPLAFFLTNRLKILQLGDEIAITVGSSIERDRLALLAVASLLAALAVSVVGPLGFVALIVPQAARLLVGSITGGVLIFTALLGGFFLLGADLIAQRLFAPVMLPAGVITATFGGPYFLYLLARHNRAT
ncbi:MAG: iron ABC transporter permease [Acidimicrobiaceae bacterium]|nr:iron ABC transporter permease [Acidimicrobiaceae bacterium]MBU97483.1 iron ABC transporter permease [Acidimicrobiaceae bacterium]|tara:strand:- start:2489 stop:3619 length:1131 start_codon:yes stop_codon:yes gene_type:complete